MVSIDPPVYIPPGTHNGPTELKGNGPESLSFLFLSPGSLMFIVLHSFLVTSSLFLLLSWRRRRRRRKMMKKSAAYKGRSMPNTFRKNLSREIKSRKKKKNIYKFFQEETLFIMGEPRMFLRTTAVITTHWILELIYIRVCLYYKAGAVYMLRRTLCIRYV